MKSHLQSTFEEADSRIPLHVLDSLRSWHRVCVVIFNDTDVLVALLYHMPVFLDHQLQELWIRAGVGALGTYPSTICLIYLDVNSVRSSLWCTA